MEFEMTKPQCVAYTDGAHKKTTQVGGWGYFIAFTDTYSNLEFTYSGYGGSRDTTNQQMEMTAMIECLKNIPSGYRAKIHSDSKYVLVCCIS